MCVVQSTNFGARPYNDHYGFCFILCFHFDFSIINEHEMDTGLFVQCLVTHSSVHCTLYALAVRLMGGQIEWNWRFCLPTTLVTFDTLLSSTIIRKNVLNNMLLARHPLKFTCHTKYACTQRVCSALSHCVNTWICEIHRFSHNKWSITSWKHGKNNEAKRINSKPLVNGCHRSHTEAAAKSKKPFSS